MKMKNSLVSVIIPVFNVKDFVGRCLESVSGQTYRDFEAIVVDDGSTDGSGTICDDFCLKDPRFRVIHQEKAGVGFARNTGLDNARGTYILFVDSDDYLFPEALQIARDHLVSGPFDWVMFDYTRKNVSEASLPDSSKTENKESVFNILDRDTALLGLLRRRDPVYYVIWNKLYSKQVIGDIRFKDVCYFEDVLFNYEVFRRSRLFVRIFQPLYLWQIREGSLTSKTSPDRFLSQFKSLLVLENLSRSDGAPMRGLCLQKIYRQLLIIRFHLMDSAQCSEFLPLAKELKDNTFREYLSNKNVSLFEKSRTLLFWSCPRLMKTIFKALGN
jgi:glycosyltransferase EpsJ